MADMLEIANEVQDTLGRSYGMPDDIDEADLDAGMQILALSINIQILLIHFYAFTCRTQYMYIVTTVA